MEKKLRFGDLVRQSGRPELKTLWLEPKKDRALTRAIQDNRVLTVIQESGNRKDFGDIGFKHHPHATYLIFPRPLPPAGRVIGINYLLMEQPEVRDPVRAKDLTPQARPLKPTPTKKDFKVRVRRTAMVEDEVRVEAADRPAAERQAVERVKGKPFAIHKAEVRVEAVEVVTTE